MDDDQVFLIIGQTAYRLDSFENVELAYVGKMAIADLHDPTIGWEDADAKHAPPREMAQFALIKAALQAGEASAL